MAYRRCRSSKTVCQLAIGWRGCAIMLGLRMLLVALVLLVLIRFEGTVYAQSKSGAQQLTSGSGSAIFRDEAAKTIPFSELTPDARDRLDDVLKNTNLYRRLPASSILIDPDYFVTLARNPEIVVEIWRLMGVTQMETTRTGPYTLHSNDGAGTVSDIELIYGTDNYHLYYATGNYNGPLNRRPLTGRCVLILRTDYSTDEQGNSVATNHLDVFLKVENAAAGLIARSLSPVVGRTADHNFIESMTFLQRLNETTERNGPGVQGMAYRLDGLTDSVRDQFIEAAGAVYERKLLRNAQSSQDLRTGSPSTSRTLPITQSAQSNFGSQNARRRP